MITFSGVSKTESTYEYSFKGMSDDTKPLIADFPKMQNGSTFLEMDTKKLYFYNADNDEWV